MRNRDYKYSLVIDEFTDVQTLGLYGQTFLDKVLSPISLRKLSFLLYTLLDDDADD